MSVLQWLLALAAVAALSAGGGYWRGYAAAEGNCRDAQAAHNANTKTEKAKDEGKSNALNVKRSTERKADGQTLARAEKEAIEDEKANPAPVDCREHDAKRVLRNTQLVREANCTLGVPAACAALTGAEGLPAGEQVASEGNATVRRDGEKPQLPDRQIRPGGTR